MNTGKKNEERGKTSWEKTPLKVQCIKNEGHCIKRKGGWPVITQVVVWENLNPTTKW
jgi:hypothetical protein